MIWLRPCFLDGLSVYSSPLSLKIKTFTTLLLFIASLPIDSVQVFCLCGCMCTMCVQCLQRGTACKGQKRVSDPRTAATGGCKCLCECWELNLDILHWAISPVPHKNVLLFCFVFITMLFQLFHSQDSIFTLFNLNLSEDLYIDTEMSPKWPPQGNLMS